MGKNDKRVVTKHLHLESLTPNQISINMKEVLGDHTASNAAIYRQVAKGQQSRKSTEHDHRSGRHVEACTDDNIKSLPDTVQKV